MTLAIEQQDREGIQILALVGHLTVGPEDIAFRTVLDNCIAAGKIKIILDFGRLANIDGVGLGTLVFYHETLQRAGGKVVLMNLARTHMELLVSAKLEVLFEVYGDQLDAVNSFFPERAVRHFDILEFVEEQNRTDAETQKQPSHD
jgi:anti-sigma B factor antagonist